MFLSPSLPFLLLLHWSSVTGCLRGEKVKKYRQGSKRVPRPLFFTGWLGVGSSFGWEVRASRVWREPKIDPRVRCRRGSLLRAPMGDCMALTFTLRFKRRLRLRSREFPDRSMYLAKFCASLLSPVLSLPPPSLNRPRGAFSGT